MTSAAQTVRLRRQRRRRATGGGMPGAALLAVVSVAVLSLGGVVVAGGRAVLAAAAGLPPASSLETFFGPQGRERFRPAQLFDRSGTVLLAEVIHPLAQDRQWRSLDSLPQAVRQATVASLDSTFWTNPGYNPSAAARALARSVVGGASPEAPRTITEMVARQALVGGSSPALAGMLLAGDIAAAYPKERVLEWFLNSADYGNLAFGIDAAARVYLGKPATDLTLAEAAMLAALPGHPEVDPLAEPAAARALQEEVLQSLRAQGFITAAEQRAAQTQPINLRREEARQAMQGLGFVETVWQELRTRLGAGAAQSGIRVITTLDLDLQLQADCVARSYLERMSGGDPTSVLPAADGSPCAAASLLPPIRPGDSGIDHGIDGAATVLLDPASGEVLALTGPAGEPHAAGSILTPFVVLSALSRGYTPATMVIDSSGSAAGGPMRLRTALAEDNDDVTGQLLRALGGDVVESTLDSIGLGLAGGEQVGEADTRVRLDELTAA
ncbi:MAG TPA: transglycosylase domain-containing protein, partial [Anaerolineales bacterium]|nr:transglycosylase domain-containing protein [Anaerolineales bacterium]